MSGIVSDNQGRSSGLVKSGVTTYDDDKLQSNIALLGFKTAVNGSLAKYNLQDQIIDEYEDATGIDAGNSTNENLTSGVYSGVAASNPTGATSTDTSVAGYRIEVLSAASGSLVIPSSANVTMLVVAGGGSGAGGSSGFPGGGGAGGLIYKSSHALTAQTDAWVTGAGGAAQSGTGVGNTGADSTWTDASANVEFTAKGGGGGGSGSSDNAGDGGSGGGTGYGSHPGGSSTQSGEAGDSGTYGFGYAGGAGSGGSPNYNPGGGGGAGSVGQAGDASTSGNGGTGKDYSAIFGTAVGDSGWFASGGGGAWTHNGNSGAGTASAGGGSAGRDGADTNASSNADANTGGGSGGGTPSGTGGSGIILVKYADGAFEAAADLTLQSTDTTASTANPDYADMVCLIEDAEGTATLNTDIKGYISEDSGSTWTQGTFVDEGSWGANKKIIAFHDLDISAQSGSSMCYKITTHNQSAGSKETKIHATSIGWKA